MIKTKKSIRVEKAGKKLEEAKEKARKKFVEDSVPLYEAPLDAGEREASESVDDKKAVEIRPLNQTRPIKRPN